MEWGRNRHDWELNLSYDIHFIDTMNKLDFRFPFRPVLGPSSIGRIRWMTGILSGILVSLLLFAWFYIGAQVIETIASRIRLGQISPVSEERLWTLAILSGTLGTSVTSWI